MAKYALHLPDELMDEVREVAAIRGCSLLQAFKDLIKWGFLFWGIHQKKGAKLIIDEGDSQREIVVI